MERVHDVPAIPLRDPDSHKGTYGRVLIVAGSPRMPGAAVLAARAALRSGAGLVTAAIPRSIGGIIGAAVPEATQLLLPDAAGAEPEGGAEATLAPRLEHGTDAVGLGPGLGTEEGSMRIVRSVLGGARSPLVIDADALNAIALRQQMRPARPERCVWTPHPGEFERLLGERPREAEERVASSARFVERYGGTVVLKGHRTVVCDGARYYVNVTGNAGMATGGSGDVLTGMLACFLAQGFVPFDAARLAVHLHGLAGDMAREALGEAGMIAGDILERIPAAIRSHQNRRREGP